MLYKVCNTVTTIKPVRLYKTSSEERVRRVIPVNTDEFRYLRFRAIGCMEWPTSGPNGNADGFPYEGFEDDRPGYGYRSFINKRAHVEHNSHEGYAGSIGDLPDAYLDAFIFPPEYKGKKWADLIAPEFNSVRSSILSMPNQRDGSIEVLMRIDTRLVESAQSSSQLNSKTKAVLSRLIRMIDTGQKLACSMGANIDYSVCSVCGNKARFANEYCEHIAHKRGTYVMTPSNQLRDLLTAGTLRPEWIPHLVTSRYDADNLINGQSNKIVLTKAVELNFGPQFFELSVVAFPAFSRAWQLEKLARKQTEDRKEYLKRIASELGDDDLLDLYSLLQERGLISTQCAVS